MKDDLAFCEQWGYISGIIFLFCAWIEQRDPPRHEEVIWSRKRHVGNQQLRSLYKRKTGISCSEIWNRICLFVYFQSFMISSKALSKADCRLFSTTLKIYASMASFYFFSLRFFSASVMALPSPRSLFWSEAVLVALWLFSRLQFWRLVAHKSATLFRRFDPPCPNRTMPWAKDFRWNRDGASFSATLFQSCIVLHMCRSALYFLLICFLTGLDFF